MCVLSPREAERTGSGADRGIVNITFHYPSAHPSITVINWTCSENFLNQRKAQLSEFQIGRNKGHWKLKTLSSPPSALAKAEGHEWLRQRHIVLGFRESGPGSRFPVPELLCAMTLLGPWGSFWTLLQAWFTAFELSAPLPLVFSGVFNFLSYSNSTTGIAVELLADLLQLGLRPGLPPLGTLWTSSIPPLLCCCRLCHRCWTAQWSNLLFIQLV